MLYCKQQDTWEHATKVTHLCNLLFRQPDDVNCVVRRVYLAIIAKLSQNRVVHWWIMDVNRCVHVDPSQYLLTFIGDLRYEMLLI